MIATGNYSSDSRHLFVVHVLFRALRKISSMQSRTILFEPSIGTQSLRDFFAYRVLNKTSRPTSSEPRNTQHLQRMSRNRTFKSNLITWLGSASNGIKNLFAKNLHAKNPYFTNFAVSGSLTASSTLRSKLCVDDACVTRDQFKALVE